MSVEKPANPGPIRLSRRRVLQVGAATALGVSLPAVLRADDRRADHRGAQRSTADSLILIYLNGGPSHLDMWDPKPDAPTATRGEFRPIATSLPTVSVCEHLARFARVIHQGTLIRSVHHGVNLSHPSAVYCSLTGHERGARAGNSRANDLPSIGSAITRYRAPADPVVSYATMPFVPTEGPGGLPQPGFFAGFLGRSYDPLTVSLDPTAEDLQPPELALPVDVHTSRFDSRLALRKALDARTSRRALERQLQDFDTVEARAVELLTSGASQRAFRLDLEDPRTRERYGRNVYGQSVLLARRLIEAGTRVACVCWTPDIATGWDTHG
jgi:hypothetical protein